MRFEIESVHPEDVRAVHLLDLLQSEYVGMYGEPDPNPEGGLESAIWPNGEVMLILAEKDRVPVAVGGWTTLEEGVGCLRRMYVRYDHRNQGYSRILLGAVEASARSAGLTRLVLETGTAQLAALSLYRSSGYTPSEPFGFYAGAPESVFLGRNL